MAKAGRVKGASFIRAWEKLRGLVEGGVVSRDALRVQLSPDAFALYEEKILPSLWYPLAAVDEFSRVLVDLEGDGDPAYMRSVGANALGALLERESFRSFIEGAMRQRDGEGQALVQLAGLVYDFGEWTFEGRDLFEFRATMVDAEPLPALAAETIAGFVEALVEHCMGTPIRVTAERPELGRVVFDATRA